MAGTSPILHAKIAPKMSQAQWNAVEEYLTSHLIPPDKTLDAVVRSSAEAGLPAIQVSPVEGRFLNLLARLQGARRILEIGTLGG